MKDLMKRFFLFLTLAVTACGFVACSDDDDNGGSDTSIVGTWAAEVYEDGSSLSITYTFTSNGLGKLQRTMKDSTSSYTESETFSYTYDAGILIINYDEGGIETWYVTRTGNTLMLNDGEGGLLTLKRK